MFEMPMDWLQLGVAGGALAVLVMLGRSFFKQSHDLMDHYEVMQNEILEYFTNHMSENNKQQADTAEALRGLTRAIEAISVEVRYTRIAQTGAGVGTEGT